MKKTYLKITAAAAICAISTSLSFPSMAAQRFCMPSGNSVNISQMANTANPMLTGKNGNGCFSMPNGLSLPNSFCQNTIPSHCSNLNFCNIGANCCRTASDNLGNNGSTPNFGNIGNNSSNSGSGNIGSNGSNSGSGNIGSNDSNSASAYVSQVLSLVNEERAKAGLSPLVLDSGASKAAEVRAKEIVSNFSHTRPNGSSFSSVLTENGVSYRTAGENIAYGQNTPSQVMNGWMNSSGHRANILNQNFTKIGIGHYEDANGTDYWVQLFLKN